MFRVHAYIMQGFSTDVIQTAASAATAAELGTNFDQLVPDSQLFAINLQAIHAAHDIIKPFVHKTPLVSSQQLDKLTGLELYFKLEAQQRTGSFKASSWVWLPESHA